MHLDIENDYSSNQESLISEIMLCLDQQKMKIDWLRLPHLKAFLNSIYLPIFKKSDIALKLIEAFTHVIPNAYQDLHSSQICIDVSQGEPNGVFLFLVSNFRVHIWVYFWVHFGCISGYI